MIAVREKIYNRLIGKANVYCYNSTQNSLLELKIEMENLFIEDHMETIRDYIHRELKIEV
jgi:hypothetical protein